MTVDLISSCKGRNGERCRSFKQDPAQHQRHVQAIYDAETNINGFVLVEKILEYGLATSCKHHEKEELRESMEAKAYLLAKGIWRGHNGSQITRSRKQMEEVGTNVAADGVNSNDVSSTVPAHKRTKYYHDDSAINVDQRSGNTNLSTQVNHQAKDPSWTLQSFEQFMAKAPDISSTTTNYNNHDTAQQAAISCSTPMVNVYGSNLGCLDPSFGRSSWPLGGNSNLGLQDFQYRAYAGFQEGQHRYVHPERLGPVAFKRLLGINGPTRAEGNGAGFGVNGQYSKQSFAHPNSTSSFREDTAVQCGHQANLYPQDNQYAHPSSLGPGAFQGTLDSNGSISINQEVFGGWTSQFNNDLGTQEDQYGNQANFQDSGYAHLSSFDPAAFQGTLGANSSVSAEQQVSDIQAYTDTQDVPVASSSLAGRFEEPLDSNGYISTRQAVSDTQADTDTRDLPVASPSLSSLFEEQPDSLPRTSSIAPEANNIGTGDDAIDNQEHTHNEDPAAAESAMSYDEIEDAVDEAARDLGF